MYVLVCPFRPRTHSGNCHSFDGLTARKKKERKKEGVLSKLYKNWDVTLCYLGTYWRQSTGVRCKPLKPGELRCFSIRWLTTWKPTKERSKAEDIGHGPNCPIPSHP